jgi:hypothetical protein
MGHKLVSYRKTAKVLVIVAAPICLLILLLLLSPCQPTEVVAQGDVSESDTLARQVSSSSWSVTDSWVSGGPYGGAIRELIVTPCYGNCEPLIFAGTWGGGVYRRDLSWTEWYPINANLPNGLITALAISPNYENDRTLFVAVCGWRVYQTTNGGNAWQPAWEGITSTEVTALAVSPAYASDGIVYAGTADSGIYRSTDGGENWTQVNTGLNNLSIVQIIIAPDFNLTGRVYALTYWTVHRSDDGVTWTPLDACPDGANELTIALTPAGDTLFVGTDSKGVYSTTATGSGWSPANAGISENLIDDLAISPNFAADHTLWAADGLADRVYRSTNGGVSWTEAISGLTAPDASQGTSPFVLDVSPNYGDDATVFVGSKWHGGVFRSRSGGDQWRPFSSGLSWFVEDIAVSPAYTTDGTVFAGVNGGGILKSVDRGASWQMASNGYHGDGFAVALSPGFANDRTAFMGGWEIGVYRSVDAGLSWHQRGLAGNTINALAISPSDSISNSEILAGTNSGLYKSTDVGLSWSVITQGLPISSVRAIAYSPAYTDDHTVFLGSGCSSAMLGVFRSITGGTSWTYLSGGPDDHVYALALSPDFSNDHTVFASTYDALFKSTSAGDAWSITSLTAKYVTDIVFSPNYDTDRTIWASTSEDGVYLSTDGGDTWASANNHLGDLKTRAIAISPARASGTSDVFVGTLSMGVWQIYQDVDLIVRARGTVASSVWPNVEVRFNDTVVANWVISTTEYTLWMTDTAVTGQDKVDVAFLNNGGEVSPDDQRDVFIDLVQVGNEQVSSRDISTVIDRGSTILYDGVGGIPGAPTLYWGAALRFLAGVIPESPLPLWSKLQRVITDTRIDDSTNWPNKREINLDTNLTGQTLMAWQDFRNYDWTGDIYAQWLLPDGTLLGPNIPVNDDGSPYAEQGDPSVLVNDDGSAIIVWTDYRNNYDIFAQRFDSNGGRLGTNYSVTDGSLERHYEYPDIDGIGDGSFTVVWNQNCAVRIFARWYDQTGSPISGTVQVSEEMAEETRRSRPKVAVSRSGRTLIAWHDQRNGDFDIYGQWFRTDGTPLGDNFRINDDTGDAEQLTPDVSASDERFLVVWRDYRLGDEDIYAQRFDGEGNSIDSNFRVNDDTGKARQHAPCVACDRTGWCAVTWWDRRGVVPDVYAQLYDQDGLTRGNNFKVESGPSDSSQFDPAVAWDEQDNIWFAWSDNREEKLNLDIYTSEWHVDKDQDPSSDQHEPDDTCAQANLTPTDSSVQSHNFHDQGDADWVKFNAEAGTTYVIQTSNTGPDADTVLELYDACGGSLEASDDNDFGPGARIVWSCPDTGIYSLKVSGHDPNAYGDLAYYDLSIRAQFRAGIAIILAGRKYNPESLQANINYIANQAFRVFNSGGIAAEDIYYLHHDASQDADEDGSPDVDDTATATALEYALTTWAVSRAGPGIPLYLHLVDHGTSNLFLIDGYDDAVNPSQLDDWLNTLESNTGCQVNVIIESCKSGSFIDVPQEISKSGRVIVTSAASHQDAHAYLDGQGAYFSNHFLSLLGDKADLWTSFSQTRDFLESIRLEQTPWLDDNGDAISNEQDGSIARQRGLISPTLGAIPWIAKVSAPIQIEGYTAVVTATIYDDNLLEVWAEIIAPSYHLPSNEDEMVYIDVPQIRLTDGDGDGVFTGVYGGFTEIGAYQVIVYARDEDANQGLPKSTTVRTGWPVFLPLVMRSS